MMNTAVAAKEKQDPAEENQDPAEENQNPAKENTNTLKFKPLKNQKDC